jgi:hypothetical protein
MMPSRTIVTPAQAGVPLLSDRCQGSGIPAFAGMTGQGIVQ